MEEQIFEVGDVVKLNSGSVSMTVTKISEGEGGKQAECVWFNFDDYKIMRCTFPEEALELDIDSLEDEDDVDFEDMDVEEE